MAEPNNEFGPLILEKDLSELDICIGRLNQLNKVPVWTDWCDTLYKEGVLYRWTDTIKLLRKTYKIEKVFSDETHNSAVLRFSTLEDMVAFRLRFSL